VIESAADEFGTQSSTLKVEGGEQVRLDLQLKS
jgi:hypothetical protein